MFRCCKPSRELRSDWSPAGQRCSQRSTMSCPQIWGQDESIDFVLFVSCFIYLEGLRYLSPSAGSVLDRAGPDPDFHVDADPDPDPDWHQNDADPHADPFPSFTHAGELEYLFNKKDRTVSHIHSGKNMRFIIRCFSFTTTRNTFILLRTV